MRVIHLPVRTHEVCLVPLSFLRKSWTMFPVTSVKNIWSRYFTTWAVSLGVKILSIRSVYLEHHANDYHYGFRRFVSEETGILTPCRIVEFLIDSVGGHR